MQLYILLHILKGAIILITIQEYTTKHPIQLIGEEAGICWGADTTDRDKNFKRGLNCLSSGHGRTFEFPDVYMIIDGYSARVIREWYTHIGGSPTRLQASTRYIDYDDFDFVIPESIEKNPILKGIYVKTVDNIRQGLVELRKQGASKEDSAMLLPIGMKTKMVCKHNLRNLIDMSHQRMCQRAYKEYRDLFNDVANALKDYSDEWRLIVDSYFEPKCKYLGHCPEKNGCGKFINKGDLK